MNSAVRLFDRFVSRTFNASQPLKTSWLRAVVVACCLGAIAKADDQPVGYARDIKPLLSNHCYACHGPDEGQRKAELRLDVRDEALVSAIVPGKADESDLIRRVTSSDPEVRMPPVKSKKRALNESEIQLLRRWIEQGAKFDTHWAYTPLNRPAPPAAVDGGWPKNDIDHFIARGHEAQGVKPSPDADRRTLIRRLCFDLIGLPPQVEAVEKFVASLDAEYDASYAAVVDELLASENFGERMAMFWLDLVRYADTNGVHGDNHREHDMYRDYVIESFNKNKRFDQFTVEQLAGDLLPNPTKEQRIGSGYNRLNLTTQEGGAQAKEYIAKYDADRVRNASIVWLGSTLGCAQCHNHKFDPFTQRDFYSFAAFFADIQETPVGAQVPTPIPTDEQEAQIKQIDEQLAAQRNVLNTQTPELDAALEKWVAQKRADLKEQTSVWRIIAPEKVESSGGSTLTVQDDQSVLSSGENPANDTYTVTLNAGQEKITGVRLEAITHASFANESLSRGNGNYVLTRFEVEINADANQPRPVKLTSAVADFSQNGYAIASAIDDDPKSGWAVDGHTKRENRKAVFVFEKPETVATGATITVRLRHESGFAQHNIGRFRLALTSIDKPTLDDRPELPDNILAIIQLERDQRTAQQRDQLAGHFRGVCNELAATRKLVAELEANRKKITDSFRPVLISTAVAPRTIRVLPRGNWLDDSGEVVQPAVPQFLGALDVPDRHATRLDLAQWIVRPDNPLVARVFVNRLWKSYFGKGLVTSLDDYGAQGTLPSHPELLDWLATQFIDSGWDVKQMVKLIVTSRAYRQSSLESKELRERDPMNKWLARQNRFRLSAELVRDNALAVSGLLVNKLGGPSVKPYQPTGYWDHLNFPQRTWVHDKGESLYRRGMYTYWCRTFPHPSMMAFDAQSREESCVERAQSNTPLQALVLLNDPTYVEAARVFAARIMAGGTDDQARLSFAYRQALNREPTPLERETLTKLVQKHVEQFTSGGSAASELIGVGESAPPQQMNHAELAAWTSAARVILNLHETITRN